MWAIVAARRSEYRTAFSTFLCLACRSSTTTTFTPAETVGGLARGVDPKELAALIARALPSGASPTAEIMRDASTGIERGFGYVSVAGGEGVRAGAERAIAAYNGTRCVWLDGTM